MAKRIDEQRRGSGRRLRRPVVYIICEGSETEVNYFKKFRTRYSNIDICPISSQHKSALYLVGKARETIKQEPYYPQDGDQLWCVFDRNGNTNEELQKAGRIASKHGYNIAFSNPAFELWYLLHFIDQRSYIADTDSVISILDSKHCIEKYSKSGDYYELLLPRLQQAIDRAYTLQEYHTKNGLPMLHRDSNPCTTVAQLAELLHSRANQRQF